jgi:hypothetical protein
MIRAAFCGFLVALAIALSACAGIRAEAENQTDVRVIDLKVSAAGPFGWVDNETFVVMVRTAERYKRKDGAEVEIARVATINYRTGEQKTYGKVSSGLCFADGYVSYIFADDATGNIFASYGELGKEIVRKIEPGELRFDRVLTGSCRPWNETPIRPQWLDAKTRFWNLWPFIGLINCRSADVSIRTQYVKARFHRTNDEIGVELPFSCYEVFRGLRYHPFKGAYFALEFDFRHPWPEGRDRRAYWLYPDGAVETIVLPYSIAIRESGIPTARGIIAFSRPEKRGEDYWVHLVTPGSTRRILRGNASGLTSPDGCRVAILHDPNFDARVSGRSPRTPVTLKILELCGGN